MLHFCSSLEKEQQLRRKAELESAQSRLQLQVLTDECSKLRQQVQVSLAQLVDERFCIAVSLPCCWAASNLGFRFDRFTFIKWFRIFFVSSSYKDKEVLMEIFHSSGTEGIDGSAQYKFLSAAQQFPLLPPWLPFLQPGPAQVPFWESLVGISDGQLQGDGLLWPTELPRGIATFSTEYTHSWWVGELKQGPELWRRK